ncbi:hypothetical protein [Emergencia timonensis]|uniref:hypothetical protein n=1 Tax=Emergencia timonensis TaxID=1776384 RepID=UPI00399A4D64
MAKVPKSTRWILRAARKIRREVIYVLKQVLIRLVLGKSGRYSELTMLRGKKYIVVIQPYETVDEMMKKATNNGVFMA